MRPTYQFFIFPHCNIWQFCKPSALSSSGCIGSSRLVGGGGHTRSVGLIANEKLTCNAGDND